MNTSISKRTALIGASILTAVLAGCSVEGYTARNAITKCQQHGGLVEIYNDFPSQHAKCADGSIMQYVDRRPAVESAAR
ncbi:hypothetical protein MTYP_01003 [Methylophilaceae bacterium]|nr:hypothetical protein MTYP_01003 [Methylophilaceae bacterium]